MFDGKVIEQLIAAVARAEEHARMVKATEKKPEFMVIGRVYQQVAYEAPFGASIIGAA